MFKAKTYDNADYYFIFSQYFIKQILTFTHKFGTDFKYYTISL